MIYETCRLGLENEYGNWDKHLLETQSLFEEVKVHYAGIPAIVSNSDFLFSENTGQRM